ncbi:MAG: hypothetical protein M0Z41_18290 [Peptococcaceae bacterium]|nr:hypothetical protein [Peptococcaceae bacterium]
MKDITEVLEEYIDEKNPNRWAKLSSDIQFRRLTLTLLREILQELRRLNKSTEDESKDG